MARTIRPHLAFALLAAAGLSAAANDPFDLAAWDETQLRPDANLVFWDDRLVIHPKARLTGGYDSNETQSDDASDSGFLGVAGGAEAWLLPVDDQRLQLEALTETPLDGTPGLERWPWLLRGRWERQSDGNGQSVQALSQRQDSPPLPQTGRQVDRVDNDGNAGAWWSGGRFGVGLSLGWGGQRFLEDAPEFAAGERDSQTVQIGLDASWQRAETSLVELTLGAGTVRYAEPGPYQDGRFGRVAAAWKLPLGDHSWARVAGGAAVWRFDQPWGGDASRDDGTVLAPEGGIELRWERGETTFVTAHALATSMPGVGANEDRVYDAGIFGRMAIDESWGVDAELGGTRVVASSEDPLDGADSRVGWRAGLGGELYLVTGWLNRLAVNYTDSRGGLADPFTRTIVMLQTTVIW